MLLLANGIGVEGVGVGVGMRVGVVGVSSIMTMSDSGGFLSPTWTMVLLKLQSEVVDTTLSALQCRANGVRP